MRAILLLGPVGAGDDLDPVPAAASQLIPVSMILNKDCAPVGVEDERDVPHLSVTGLLLEANAKGLKPVASSLNVVDGDGNVAKATAGVGVAAGVSGEGRVGLGAVVVGELENALALEAVLGCCLLAVIVGEEVERECLKLVLCLEIVGVVER